MMNQLRKFMYGRYGVDRFSRDIILFSLFITLIASMTRSSLLLWLAYIPLFYAIFRILSRDTQKRARENYIYADLIRKVKVRAKNTKLLLVGTRTHKFYRCKGCRQMIRIPRGKGKISISCPKCRREFISRS
ncbi:MAG: hypothetical protein GX757_09490 [Clostridiales bacterium]|nr:hypothetical protein [Clostridiales bacterium]